MRVHESAEDYLEAILMLTERKGYARSVDVANELGFSKASVSVAMKKLRESGHVEMAADGGLTLTEAGLEVARRIYDRHRLLTDFFVRLGVDPKTAARDACRVEHDLSEETFSRLVEHARKKIEKDG
ncbi:MAG TPA: metal-dependent transcriptional regulator [Candidatus Fournierella merdigallinarum]|nr:metal-dependent transcriptional regulator [Candidatus Fournierella merdigallinarum]